MTSSPAGYALAGLVAERTRHRVLRYRFGRRGGLPAAGRRRRLVALARQAQKRQRDVDELSPARANPATSRPVAAWVIGAGTSRTRTLRAGADREGDFGAVACGERRCGLPGTPVEGALSGEWRSCLKPSAETGDPAPREPFDESEPPEPGGLGRIAIVMSASSDATGPMSATPCDALSPRSASRSTMIRVTSHQIEPRLQGVALADIALQGEHFCAGLARTFGRRIRGAVVDHEHPRSVSIRLAPATVAAILSASLCAGMSAMMRMSRGLGTGSEHTLETHGAVPHFTNAEEGREPVRDAESNDAGQCELEDEAGAGGHAVRQPHGAQRRGGADE